MSQLSDAFHADLNLLKQFFFKALAKFENGAVTVLADIKVIVTDTIDQAPAVLVAAAEAGVAAAFAGNVTGGLGALFAAGEQGALSVLESQGVKLLETEALKLKALVIGHVLQSNKPTGDAAQSPNAG